MEDKKLLDAVKTMEETQCFVNPPTKEEDLINKWFAVMYVSKHKKHCTSPNFLEDFQWIKMAMYKSA